MLVFLAFLLIAVFKAALNLLLSAAAPLLLNAPGSNLEVGRAGASTISALLNERGVGFDFDFFFHNFHHCPPRRLLRLFRRVFGIYNILRFNMVLDQLYIAASCNNSLHYKNDKFLFFS